MDLKSYTDRLARQASSAARSLSSASTAAKNLALLKLCEKISASRDFLVKENEKDLKAARQAKLSSAFIDRLRLNESRIQDLMEATKAVAELTDPVGEIIAGYTRPNGLRVQKVRVPLGVIFFIYESRPNVTVDAAALCLKSSNAVILRGGSEAINSNLALHKLIKEAVKEAGLPEDSVQMVETTDRAAVGLFLKKAGEIDLVIPRGGKGLIERIARESKIPVIKHFEGVCHTYVDKRADLALAEKVSFNAKVGRPGVCNAMETLLVHEKMARRFLPGMAKRFQTAGVELRGCPKTCKILPGIKRATKADWTTEYLDLILSVRVISSLDEAIEHIQKYGSAHSDAIITTDLEAAQRFVQEVDSSAVFVNTSTRFNDGGEFGLGAEIGISTDKLHARGPMGLAELTSYKWVVYGQGQIRE